MKTAMQELIEYLEKNYYINELSNFDIDKIQFLEKEKEQIQKAYKDHHDLGHIFGIDTEQYYNQTYNN